MPQPQPATNFNGSFAAVQKVADDRVRNKLQAWSSVGTVTEAFVGETQTIIGQIQIRNEDIDDGDIFIVRANGLFNDAAAAVNVQLRMYIGGTVGSISGAQLALSHTAFDPGDGHCFYMEAQISIWGKISNLFLHHNTGGFIATGPNGAGVGTIYPNMNGNPTTLLNNPVVIHVTGQWMAAPGDCTLDLDNLTCIKTQKIHTTAAFPQ